MNTFGVVAAGAVLVLLNQRKSWDELSYELGLVEPDAILTDGDDYGFNDQLKAAYGDILRPMDGFRSYEPAQLTRCIDHEALMVLMFTSGTTGRSKGVMLSEKNFFSVMRAHTQIGEHMMLDMAEHGMFVVQTYGSTETCGDGIINYAQDAKHIGAVGQGQRLSGLQDRRGWRAVHAGREQLGAGTGTGGGPRGSLTRTAGSTLAIWPARTRTATIS